MANLAKNSNAIKNKGGNQVAIRRVLYDGSVNGSEAWFDVGHREKFQLTFEKTLDEFKAEDGNVVATESGDVKAEVQLTLMQSDSNTLNFLVDETENKYFAVVMHTGEGLGNTNQFLYIPLANIQTKVDVTYPQRRPTMTIKPLVTVTAFNAATFYGATSGTLGSWTPSPLGSLTTGCTGVAGSYFKFFEG